MGTHVDFFVELPARDDGSQWFRTSKERMTYINHMLLTSEAGGWSNLKILKHLGAGIVLALGVEDLNSITYSLIHTLNVEKIPIKIWVVLPYEDGYWTNVLNIKRLKKDFQVIHNWIQMDKLEIAGYGFDLEYNIQIAEKMDYPLQFGWELIKFWVKGIKKLIHANVEYQLFVEELIEQGIFVEEYVMPRLIHTFIGGGLWPKSKNPVVMNYTSYYPKALRRLILELSCRIWPFKGSTSAIGIFSGVEGMTPGVNISKKLPSHLSSRDLAVQLKLLVKKLGHKNIHIFALATPQTAMYTFYWADGLNIK